MITTEISPNVVDSHPFGPLIVPRQPTTWKNPVFDWGEATEVQTAPSTHLIYGFVDSHNFFKAVRNAVCTPEAPPDVSLEVCPDYYPEEWELPEVDWQEWEEQFGDEDDDGTLDPADPDDDNDGVPDADDLAPHYPYAPKPWLDPDFRAPSDPQQREALWGPMVGTWTSPGGGQCYEFQSGAKICDYPGGSTFVWIVKDFTAWMQSSGGEKESYAQPPAPPNSGGGSSGGGSDGEIPADHAERIATHAYRDPDNPRYIANIDPWDIYAPADYVEAIGRKEKNVFTTGYSDGTRVFWDTETNVFIYYTPWVDHKGTVIQETDDQSARERFFGDVNRG